MYNPDYINLGPTGWTCPKCGRVYAPSQPTCLYCNDKRVIYATKATPEWIYKENTFTGTINNEWRKNTTIDDILRRDYYDDEDLWGKPL